MGQKPPPGVVCGRGMTIFRDARANGHIRTVPMIVTLTMNPAIDISTSVEEIAPYRKLRCTDVKRDPGGGGINVARVVRRFGAEVTAIYPAGGTIGQLLRQLVDKEGIASHTIPVAEDTREDFTAYERQSGHEFRFVLPGPRLDVPEWMACLDAITDAPEPSFLVMSGSLPPGVPDDFYVRAARIARDRGARVAIDTSGKPLQAALAAGVVYLAKPNRRELQEFAGHPLEDQATQVAAARHLIARGQCEVVALTLGDQGGILVTRDGVWRGSTPPVKPVSTVGAGDSFLGAMVVRLDRGDSVVDAFRYGLAAGSSALMTAGTELSQIDNAEKLLPKINIEQVRSKAA